jgi:hypothetical protein
MRVYHNRLYHHEKANIVLVISIMDYASLSLMVLLGLAVWWMILIASGLRQSHPDNEIAFF